MSIIKKVALVAKSMQMEICISDNTIKIKNMAREHFSGSVYVIIQQLRIQIKKFNSTKGLGGEVCLMDKDSTKKQMVIR